MYIFSEVMVFIKKCVYNLHVVVVCILKNVFTCLEVKRKEENNIQAGRGIC